MKKTLFLLFVLIGCILTAQEATQKEETTSKIQLEKLESLLTKLSDKMVVVSSSNSNDNTATLSTLISALEKFENNVQASGNFQSLILKTEELNDNIKTSYSIAVTSDNDERIQVENIEKLQGELATLAKTIEESEVMQELLTKLAASDLVKELAKKKKD